MVPEDQDAVSPLGRGLEGNFITDSVSDVLKWIQTHLEPISTFLLNHLLVNVFHMFLSLKENTGFLFISKGIIEKSGGKRTLFKDKQDLGSSSKEAIRDKQKDLYARCSLQHYL